MKLVYISNSKMPASFAHGLQIMQMCEAFSINGCEVELIVPRRVGAIKEDPHEYYGISRSFKITKLPCIDFIYLSGNSFFFLLQSLSFMLFARAYLLFRQYDVAYSRDILTGFFFSNLVFELHALPKSIRGIYWYVYKNAKAIVVLTDFIKERLVRMGVGEDKVLVAPDAVNLEKFNINISKEEARRRLNLPLDKKIIGYAGMLRTMGMEKGIDIAIKSLAELKDKISDIHLLLVGGLPEDVDFYRNFSKSFGVADKMIFTGMVKYELVPLYLKAFDIAIAPFPETEHYNFYMSPLKIFEYMASGRPVVSTLLPSLRLILNDSNSILVTPGSSSELSSAILKLLTDTNLSSKIALNALNQVQNYTWEKRAGKIVSFVGHESLNIKTFSSPVSLEEYSKKYLRAGEEFVIKNYMSNGARVLDLGCGAGRTTTYIKEAGGVVIGVDISSALIERAKKNFPGIDFRVMDARKLDFENGTFDSVFFSFNGIDNLLSLPDRHMAMNEIRRILKPGGHFIYSSHNSLALPRTKTGWRIICNNLSKLRIGQHFREEEYDFGKLIQYYNNVWNEIRELNILGWKDVKVIGNSKRLVDGPKIVLSFLDKFPIYIAKK